MRIRDEDALGALADLAMNAGSRAKIRFRDISDHYTASGYADIRFETPANAEQWGLLVPLPSADDDAPWITDGTTTGKKWALAFYWWLVEQVQSPSFADAHRVSRLAIEGGSLRMNPRQTPLSLDE